VAIRATRRVANDNDPPAQHTEADDSGFTVIPSLVLNVERRPGENQFGVLEIETAFGKCGCSFPRIKGDRHRLL
jgi:hypothetical protein